ncbi:MAG TPA: 4Fe-4S dicluster domain-containing protein, partial [Candidatus Methylomirabilis sp.]|nr:4Fe-4S dicluster domain-containing protein [Candidatus Methylomirabilis sp.]
MKYVMVIDLRRCVGCNACTVACKQENATPPGVFWTRVRQYEVGSYPQGRMRFLPMGCMHCQEAPCLESCPTGATSRRPDGPVLIDAVKCIGCQYCIMACPYEARTFNDGKPREYFAGQGLTRVEETAARQTQGTVEKCTFCAHRLDEGKEPACVATCPAEARVIGDLDDKESKVARLVATGLAKPRLEELGTRPLVFF